VDEEDDKEHYRRSDTRTILNLMLNENGSTIVLISNSAARTLIFYCLHHDVLV
jgi:hypothetical protein